MVSILMQISKLHYISLNTSLDLNINGWYNSDQSNSCLSKNYLRFGFQTVKTRF